MNSLQTIFNKLLKKQLTASKLIGIQIRRKLKKQGIILTADQISSLEEKLSNISAEGNINLKLNENQIAELKDVSKSISIALNFEEGLGELSDDIRTAILSVYREVIPQIASMLHKSLDYDKLKIAQGKRVERSVFEARLEKKWSKPFILMELFYAIALEAGDVFNSSIQKEKGKRKDILCKALTMLHARACQVYAEVFALLRSGFADGAHARWRTLHEIATTAFFLKKFGNDTAERYLLHDVIESYKAAIQYQKYCTMLGYKPYTKREISNLEKSKNQLLERFGKTFGTTYGWATKALSKEDPKFSDIEKSAGLEHWRPYYKMASHNIHANPRGILFKLGLDRNQPKVLLAGPSDSGFVDPGHGATVSLAQITSTLLTTHPNIDRLAQCHLLFKIADDIGSSLFKVQNENLTEL